MKRDEYEDRLKKVFELAYSRLHHNNATDLHVQVSFNWIEHNKKY